MFVRVCASPHTTVSLSSSQTGPDSSDKDSAARTRSDSTSVPDLHLNLPLQPLGVHPLATPRTGPSTPSSLGVPPSTPSGVHAPTPVRTGSLTPAHSPSTPKPSKSGPSHRQTVATPPHDSSLATPPVSPTVNPLVSMSKLSLGPKPKAGDGDDAMEVDDLPPIQSFTKPRSPDDMDADSSSESPKSPSKKAASPPKQAARSPPQQDDGDSSDSGSELGLSHRARAARRASRRADCARV